MSEGRVWRPGVQRGDRWRRTATSTAPANAGATAVKYVEERARPGHGRNVQLIARHYFSGRRAGGLQRGGLNRAERTSCRPAGAGSRVKVVDAELTPGAVERCGGQPSPFFSLARRGIFPASATGLATASNAREDDQPDPGRTALPRPGQSGRSAERTVAPSISVISEAAPR